ncbi:GNAT family N-acetyltransferase [Secundilactobacillus oryzae]|uniref:GNAT family N-acetyltransferase n=1 Tax=Secundilactobacillus oryzae TaxID=1202668 RepID=UPI00055658D1|nr:GNAT family N-acetyltransferase [Secundilactobacillus oryzae]
MAEFQTKRFEELTTKELFLIYELRVRVFVVEQTCYYQEVDRDDLISRHFFTKDAEGNIMAYARMIPGEDGHSVHIGRVVVAPEARKSGLGRELVTKLLAQILVEFPENNLILAQAQAYLKKFYESFGFVATSQVYPVDGIPHLDMALKV